MKNARAKRAKLLFFILNFQNVLVIVLVVNKYTLNKQRTRKKKTTTKEVCKEKKASMKWPKKLFFQHAAFYNKIKELQMRHVFWNDYFGAVLCNAKRTLIRKIMRSNVDVSLQLRILT